MGARRINAPIEWLDVSAYRIPTDAPEADGTYQWDSTTMVLVEAHCVPTLHVPPCCAIAQLWPIEYFHDHVRIEHMLFEGALDPVGGALHPDLSRPWLGVELKRAEADKYRV
jgi:hypothetical protein